MPNQYANSLAFYQAFPNVFVALNTDAGREVLGYAPASHFLGAGRLTATLTAQAVESLDRDALGAPNSGAFAWEQIEIPNGTFEISAPGYGQHDFQIHTVQRGSLAGRRVVKCRDDSGPGGWRAFAFVSRQGALQLWARHRRDVDHPYVVSATALVEFLRRSGNRSTRAGFEPYDGIIRMPPIDGEVAAVATIYCNRRSCLLCNRDVHVELDDHLCTGHLPAAPEHARRVENLPDPELERLLEEEEAIERATAAQRTRRARTPRTPTFTGDGEFQIVRIIDIPMCQVTLREIQ